MGLIPDIVIVFKTGGEEKRLDFRKVPFTAWEELKRYLGFTPKTIADALGDVDVEAYAALVWLERRQWERTLSWASVRMQFERAGEVDIELIDILSDESEPDPQNAGS